MINKEIKKEKKRWIRRIISWIRSFKECRKWF